MAKEKDKSKPKVVKMTDAEEKKKALESVFSVIEKEYGTGSIMKLGDANSVDVEVIPTGSLTLDMALGVGGLPRGRVIEIYGPESSGKTTVALHVVAEAQKMGGEAAFIIPEYGKSARWYERLPPPYPPTEYSHYPYTNGWHGDPFHPDNPSPYKE